MITARAKAACGRQSHATDRAFARERKDASALPPAVLGPRFPLPSSDKTSIVRSPNGVAITNNARYSAASITKNPGKRTLDVNGGCKALDRSDLGGVYEHDQDDRS